jgi:hypothetical protein
MTELRKLIIEDMQLRVMSERTQDAYVRAMRQHAQHNTIENLRTRFQAPPTLCQSCRLSPRQNTSNHIVERARVPFHP